MKSPAMPRVSHITALYLITGVCGLVDAACYLSMGGVFAEIMTGNLLFMCFYIGTGQSIFGDAKYFLVIAAFLLGALAGGRLLRGPRAEIRIGFAVEWVLLVTALVADSAPAGGHNENWRRRFASIAIFLASATLGAALTTTLGPWAPLALTVMLFTVALTGLIARNAPVAGS